MYEERFEAPNIGPPPQQRMQPQPRPPMAFRQQYNPGPQQPMPMQMQPSTYKHLPTRQVRADTGSSHAETTASILPST